MIRRRTSARATLCAALLLFASIAAHPLAQSGSVRVNGTIKDASGGVLEGAIVDAVAAGRVVESATTTRTGQYQVEAPAGAPFEIRVRRDGFADYAASLTGTSGNVTRDVTMQIGSVSDTLVVTSSRSTESRTNVTSATTVATAGDVHTLGANALSELLRFVPGVAIEGNGREGSPQSMFTRGGESDYNLVLIDGVRVNTQGGFFDFSRVAGSEIERVEVVRGAQSAIWGSDAMSSVVQVFTRQAESHEAPTLTGSAEAGSYDSWRGDVHLLGGARRRIDYGIGVNFRRTDGAFDDALPENDWFEQTAFDGRLGVTLGSRASVTTTIRASNMQGRGVGPITFGSRDTGAAYDTKNVSWQAGVPHTLGTRYTGTGSVNYFRYVQLSTDTIVDAPYSTYAVLEGAPNALYPDGVRLVRFVDQTEFESLRAAGATPGPGQFLAASTTFDFPSNLIQERTTFDRPSVRYQGDVAWAAGHRVSAGYEWERETFDPLSTAPLSTGFALDNNAFFVQQQSTFADRWFVTFGVRVDDKESYDTFTSPKLSAGGFVVPVRPGALSSVKVFGNIGRGIKSPNFSERFGSAFADPNPDLKVERARTGDVGVEATFASQRFRGAVTYFNNDYEDQIAFRFGPVGDGIPENVNIDGSEANGWELEAALLRPASGFTASGNYSYVHTEVVTNVSTSQQFQPGQPLLRRPYHSGVARAAYRIGAASVQFDIRMIGDRHDNSFLFMTAIPNVQYPNPVPFGTDITVNPGYTVAGLGFDYRFGREATVYFRANNIGDTEYDGALGYPGMPRTVMFGVQFDPWRR
jgi:outer membrane cobalamin receptor